MHTQRTLRAIGKSAGVLFMVLGSAALAMEDFGTQSIGQIEFQKNCASCHGMGGEGDGPFVEFLKQTPPDLTMLAKMYNGVYPQERVYAWIRDVDRVRAHGTQEMPIWGDRYSKEIIEKYGPDYTGPGSSIQQRILELVFYIGTIQK